jgi:hypothetical protein
VSDEVIEILRRALTQSPGDKELKARWVMAKARVGEAVINTHYKIRYGKKYYSTNSYNTAWTGAGKRFATKAEAILTIDQAFDTANKTNYRKGHGLRTAKIDKIELVEFTTYVVTQVLNVDFVEEKNRAELGRIRKQKEDLDAQEQKILKDAAKRRKALVEQEQALLKKGKKGKTTPTKMVSSTASFKTFNKGVESRSKAK